MTAFSACPEVTSAPKIELYTSYGKLKYDFSQNNEAITKLAEKQGIIEKGLFASGLSTVNVNMDITLKTVGDIVGKYDFCVYPTTIKSFKTVANIMLC